MAPHRSARTVGNALMLMLTFISRRWLSLISTFLLRRNDMMQPLRLVYNNSGPVSRRRVVVKPKQHVSPHHPPRQFGLHASMPTSR
ncbi:hypothetical protein BD310DRAFT_91422 [Dichomitus squalens]|uniref:Uncharacterized protein n=1 Tax=Dichomitus squalens TaxID=114155 RepID=A0A4Q9Q6S6_9APHY|nr:hypothetical protein BD310DRAFT_91422 [Dichomitus squalens]